MPILKISRETDALTRLQVDTLVALVLLDRGSIEESFFREEIGHKVGGKKECVVMATMNALLSHGLVVPVGHAAVLRLIGGQSATGYDTWAPTDEGRGFADELHAIATEEGNDGTR